MVRKINFHWNLRQLMAAHDLWKTTDLIPLLAERGVSLSPAQIYRLVGDKPDRLSMKTLAALCDILSCTPADLIDPFVESSGRRLAAGETNVIDVRPDYRPERARIVDDE
jgi:DNA-binding Xre family transcriptional regulator